MKTPSIPPLRLLDISEATRKAMCHLGVGELPELAGIDPDALRYLDHRETVLREMLRLCVDWFVRPQWIRSVTIDLHPVDKAPAGYRRVSEPYAPTERWMLELAIAQLRGAPWCVVNGDRGSLTLWRGQ